MTPPLHQLVAELISDPDFLQLQRLEEQPNIFAAVGQTFTERWHSGFLGWLLNPSGSHGLGDFPLLQFLVALVGGAQPPSASQTTICSPQELADLATSLDLSRALVLPNERQGSEMKLGDYGRIDVYVEVEPETDADDGPSARFIALVEVKVKASIANSQEAKYPAWLEAKQAAAAESDSEAPIRGICVFLCPTDQLGDSSEETIGDPRWYCIDFQLLHDRVLVPCLEHRDLSETMRPLLEHYVWNLRSAVKGEKLAVTAEETELARRICAKHAKTFKLLAEIIRTDEDQGDVAADLEAMTERPTSSRTGQSPLSVELEDGTKIYGLYVRSFFLAAFKLLDDRGLLGKVEIPFSIGGRNRWFLNSEPIHRGGQDFTRALQYEPTSAGVDPFYFEVNSDRPGAIKAVKKLCRSVGLKAKG